MTVIRNTTAETHREWVHRATKSLDSAADHDTGTRLLRFPMPRSWNIELFLLDESSNPTGSLKHRLARSLFLYNLVNNRIGPQTVVIEASSGSTAVSEAYFAKMLGLSFISVVPASTSPEKIALINSFGGACHLVSNPGEISAESLRLAERTGGHFMDQFTYAAVATDWRTANIGQLIFERMAARGRPEPEWIVVGAGTGGTSATIGRYCRFRGHDTKVAVADPEGSAYFDAWTTGDDSVVAAGSRIEGIGRPRVEPSFIPALVDAMVRVPDVMSLAAVRLLRDLTGIHAGGSTGTNLVAAFRLIADMVAEGRTGSVVTLICDSGARYARTYYNDTWVRAQGLDLDPALRSLRSFLATATLTGAQPTPRAAYHPAA